MPILTDVQWSAIEPLIEAVRPQTGRELTNLRRTVEAIVWRMQNGAKWRAIPAELGPWWMAAQTFIRWSKLGVWERFFEAAKATGRPALGMVFMDGTILRAHQKAAGAAKGEQPSQAIARGQRSARPQPGRLRHQGPCHCRRAGPRSGLCSHARAGWRGATKLRSPRLCARCPRLGRGGSRLLLSRGAHGGVGAGL
jgi:transposase